MKARQYIFAARPYGIPTEEVFSLQESEIPGPMEGELLLRAMYFSVDPYMRGRMNDTKSYAKSWTPGQVVEGYAVAVVDESRSAGFSKGDVVTGIFPWSDFFNKSAAEVRKVDAVTFPPEYYLGILGMPGLTAYFGITDICRPKPGETVVVSGAAGAVGHVAGQLARLCGARVIGIAGSDDKCRILKEEFGFNEAVNYKTSKSIRKDIATLCPDGVNAYFDNVGGDITDGVAASLAPHSRIALCGLISQYNSTKIPPGSFMMSILLTRSVLLKGFIVRDYSERFDEAFEALSQWVKDGRLKYIATVKEGFDKLPEAFLGLFTGANTGKMIVKV